MGRNYLYQKGSIAQKLRLAVFCLLIVYLPCHAQSAPANRMIRIKAGTYRSFTVKSKSGASTSTVPSFYLSAHAVTNEEYLAFVKANPQWRKSKASRLYTDENYLRNWKNDTAFNNEVNPNSPVVYVSWFAANAYCQWKNLRLPSTAEWEWAGKAPFVWPAAFASLSVRQATLKWYEKPAEKTLPEVTTVNKNAFGIYDMHGLIWEWVSDFNNFVGSTDSRVRDNSANTSFCAAGALNAGDTKDYAAFLRYSFRSSLKGRYCIATLGFRCARNLY